MFRSAILITLGAAITAFVSFFIVVSYPVLPRGERTVHRLAILWARILLWISSVKTEVVGRENILHGRSQIFMANHQSGFDILIVLAHIDTYFAWIAKKELFSIPVFGDAMRKGGYIPIDRKNFVRAMRSISDAARIIREGKSVMTFPEGTRSMDNQIHPFKKGRFSPCPEGGGAYRAGYDHRKRGYHAQEIVPGPSRQDHHGHRQAHRRHRLLRGNNR